MVRLQFIPIGGSANLETQKAVLVAILVKGIKVNFGQVFMRDHKIAIALFFPCIIIELCKLAMVLIITGVNNR